MSCVFHVELIFVVVLVLVFGWTNSNPVHLSRTRIVFITSSSVVIPTMPSLGSLVRGLTSDPSSDFALRFSFRCGPHVVASMGGPAKEKTRRRRSKIKANRHMLRTQPTHSGMVHCLPLRETSQGKGNTARSDGHILREPPARARNFYCAKPRKCKKIYM